MYLGSLYALLTSRESPRATLQSAASIFGATVIGSAYIVVSVSFVINFPVLHLIWNNGSCFLTFYLLSAVNDHAASSIWAFMIVTGVPLWDRHLPAEVNLEDTLRITLIAVVGLAVTVAVELVFARRRAGDEILLPIAERLDAVRSVLVCYAEGRPVDSPTRKTVLRLAMVGTSRLRRLLRRSDYPRHYRAVMNAVAAAAGRLVDISAALTQLGFEPSDAEKLQLRNLAEKWGGFATISGTAGFQPLLSSLWLPSPPLVHLNVGKVQKSATGQSVGGSAVPRGDCRTEERKPARGVPHLGWTFSFL